MIPPSSSLTFMRPRKPRASGDDPTIAAIQDALVE